MIKLIFSLFLVSLMNACGGGDPFPACTYALVKHGVECTPDEHMHHH